VGKSTFLNSVLGRKVSIVTPRAQTTRNRIVGIKTLLDAQVVFLDTPGIHRPRHGLGAAMVRAAIRAVRDVDVVLLMVEPRPPAEPERQIIKLLSRMDKPVLLLLNKTDTVKKPSLLPVIGAYGGLFPFKDIIPISALRGDGLALTVEKIVGLLPHGPMYYPGDMATDMAERFMVAEIVREKVIGQTEEEVPHSIAVEVAGWEEEKNGTVSIRAIIYVEKEGQKGIIIGKGGGRLKRIGSLARRDIEGLLGAKTYIELWVKVKRKWRTDRVSLTEFGYR
jgi:GTP-binding protein Era